LWIGNEHIKGKPPKIKPTERPGLTKDNKVSPLEQINKKVVDYLNQFAPPASGEEDK
jgi:hypothetical protein